MNPNSPSGQKRIPSAEVSLIGDATTLTGKIGSFVDSPTAVGRNYGRLLLSGIDRGLSFLLAYLRNVGHPWWELGDRRLADIGKTPGDAEVEKLRHRPVIRDPSEVLAHDASWRLGA